MKSIARFATAALLSLLLSAAALAQPLQFRDRTFEIGSIYLYEHRDLISGQTSTLDPTPFPIFIEAVNGKLAWIGDGWACGVSLVYLPGKANAGKVDCPVQRTGTASQWNERSSSATFQTTAKLEGNVLTLHGELKGTHWFKMSSCGTLRSSDVTQVTVVQDLKMRITGETCQVLEFSVVETNDENGTLNGRPTHDITRTVSKAATPSTCTITRRSDPRPPGQPLRDPYVEC